jgi:CMP-N,N'-diacetyllegionaminic acid synthase
MNVLFLITARGGSKSVPKKNIREIGGLPLIAYKAIAATKAQCGKKRIMLSTDSEEIIQVGRKHGIEVPFIRPAELATDTASSIDVVLHSMRWVEENDPCAYDVICLLEPSSPFGTGEEISQGLLILQNKKDAGCVVSVKPTEPNSVFIVPLAEDGSLSLLAQRIKNLKKVRRQDFKKEYTPSGAFYMSRWESFKKEKTFYTPATYPVIQDSYYGIEIDSMSDLELAEYYVLKGLVDIKKWNS